MAKSQKAKRRKLNALELQRRHAINFILQNENFKFADRLYPGGEPDWSDSKIRSAAADRALAFNLFSEPGDGPCVPEPALWKAFETFSLDGMNPYHWRFLLGILAVAQFGKSPKKEPKPKRPIGRPRGPSKWTDEKQSRLSDQLEQVVSICVSNKWTIGRKAIAEVIRKSFPADYRIGDENRIAREVSKLFKAAVK